MHANEHNYHQRLKARVLNLFVSNVQGDQDGSHLTSIGYNMNKLLDKEIL